MRSDKKSLKRITRPIFDDIKLFEPKLALRGGLDGYGEIKRVIKKSSKLLKEKGRLIIEIGDGQKNQTLIFLKKNGFYINKVCKDLSEKDHSRLAFHTFRQASDYELFSEPLIVGNGFNLDFLKGALDLKKHVFIYVRKQIRQKMEGVSASQF